MGKIIAIGVGSPPRETDRLDQYIVLLPGKASPKLLFILITPTCRVASKSCGSTSVDTSAVAPLPNKNHHLLIMKY